MITKLIDGGVFDEIKGMRLNDGTHNGKAVNEVSVKDFTRDELLDMARTYYLTLQEIEKKFEDLSIKILNSMNNAQNAKKN